jgi:hypothetical protein
MESNRNKLIKYSKSYATNYTYRLVQLESKKGRRELRQASLA